MSAGDVRDWRRALLNPWVTVTLAGLVLLVITGVWWDAAVGANWWQLGALTQGLAWCAAAEVARRASARASWTTGLLFATGALLLTACVLLPFGLSVRAVADLVWVGLAITLPVALSSYPQGGPRTSGERAAAAVLVFLGVLGLVAGEIGPASYASAQLRGGVACGQLALLVAFLWWRGEHGDAQTRIALLWLGLGVGAGGLLVGHLVFAAETATLLTPLVVVVGLLLGLLMPASVAIGLAAPRLYDVRRLISQATVAIVMVDLTIGIVAGTLATLSLLTGAPATKGSVAVVATACAVAFGPMLVRVRRITEEILFGGSTDPLDAMARLGVELGADSSLDAWAEALRTGLVVPRVELRIGDVVLAAAGSGGGVTESTSLVVGGEHIGDLVLTLPVDAPRLPRNTRAVLGLLAGPLARALQAVQLAEELRSSRERVVQAREEERRRLRRDLHDGLGPVLTGVAYTADAATNLLRSDVDRAGLLLGQVREDTTAAIAEIRRIVEGLRPPALDEIGLAGALRQAAVRFAGAVEVDVRSELAAANSPGGLPAAVEVVAYRVAVEALTNAARHARSGADGSVLHVDICVAASAGAVDELAVTIQDDGASAAPWASGTGLASMVARCDEVGGSLVAGPTATGGRVEARLPLGQPIADAEHPCG